MSTNMQNLIKQTLAAEEKEGIASIELAKITGTAQLSQEETVQKEEVEEPDELKDTKNVEVKQGFLKRIVAKCSSKDQPKKPVAFESNPNLRVKNTIKRIVNGRFVLTLMTFVTIFALIGDDIRLSVTKKESDIYFSAFLMISLILFSIEILASSVAIDDYKYSFYFYLDIVATLSIISDVAFLLDFVSMIFGMGISTDSVNAIPGVMIIENALNAKIAQVVKALRLIRLVRIIKLYKYIKQSMSKEQDEEESDNEEEENEKERLESLFKRETDPSKLGKALSDRNTREVIIGVLLMLMILPLLTPTENDYAPEYGVREIFWMGRSNCKTKKVPDALEAIELPPWVDPSEIETPTYEQTSFFCDEVEEPWITERGWIELLQMYVTASSIPEGEESTWEVLWLYVPDYNRQGQMSTIEKIPMQGQTFNTMTEPYYWTQNEACAGFIVRDECPWRFEEMSLITYKPEVCVSGEVQGCEELVAYARVVENVNSKQTATYQIATTLFTCVVLAVAFIVFSHDTQVHVIIPIKKVVAIIQKLAESPLKKPELSNIEEDSQQMKTKMLEQTIFKIGTLLQRGFGELGAEIISESLTMTETGMDLTLPGKKVEIVFSICRIRQFTDTTECLQEEIIVFVNKIVKIIHLCTQNWEGKPTKNYGERYMITWKLPSYDDAIDSKEGSMPPDGPPLDGQNQSLGPDGGPLADEDIFGKGPASNSGIDQSINISKGVDERTSLIPDGSAKPRASIQSGEDGSSKSVHEASQPKMTSEEKEDAPLTRQQIYLKREEVVDRAFISAVKTLAQLQRAQDLMAYSRHPRIQKTFQDKYNISISFALHVGRSIEGAIGSEFKVDALYLSADNQIGLRIDQLCDTYDRQVLMSGEFVRMLSDKGKTFARKIDQVCMEESKQAMKEIYCVDICPSDPLEDEQQSEDDITNGSFIQHMDFEHQDNSEIKKKGIQYVYELDHDFVCIQRHQKPDFLEFFQKGLDNYIEGDWMNANNNLIQAQMHNQKDGPTLWLLEFLDKQKNLAPEGWKGVRDLDQKITIPTDFVAKEEGPVSDQDANPENNSPRSLPNSP